MSTQTLRQNRIPELIRFVRFAIVGTLGTILDFSVLIILKELAGFPTLLANTLAYGTGVINNFSLNRMWTYSDAHHKRVLVQFAQFATVSTGGVLLNNLIVLSLETPFSTLFGEQGYIPAKMVATLIVVFWNFFVNRYWTFKEAPSC